MRVGVSVRSSYALDDPRVGARWMVERAAAARDAGLDSLFVGDHHATGPSGYYQNTPIMGRMLAEWGTATAGVLMLLPLWHPVAAAEQLGTLASIAEGPFVLQCALGGGEQQFAAMGVSQRHRVSHFEQGLDIIRRLLAGEQVDRGTTGRTGSRARVSLRSRPSHWRCGSARPHRRRSTVRRAWVTAGSRTPTWCRPRPRSRQRPTATRVRAHGRTPGVVAIRRDVACRCRRRRRGTRRRAGRRRRLPRLPPGCDHHRRRSSRSSSASRAYADMGYTDVIVRHLAEDQGEVLASLERLGAVREALASS